MQDHGEGKNGMDKGMDDGPVLLTSKKRRKKMDRRRKEGRHLGIQPTRES